jgi:hypothetical protein
VKSGSQQQSHHHASLLDGGPYRQSLTQLRQFGEDYDFFQGFLGVFGEVFVISRYLSVEVGAEGDGKAL